MPASSPVPKSVLISVCLLLCGCSVLPANWTGYKWTCTRVNKILTVCSILLLSLRRT